MADGGQWQTPIENMPQNGLFIGPVAAQRKRLIPPIRSLDFLGKPSLVPLSHCQTERCLRCIRAQRCSIGAVNLSAFFTLDSWEQLFY